jgi:hypothetical protein
MAMRTLIARLHAAGQALVLLLICALGALLVRHGCLHPPPPVDRPEPGTARAGYCAAVSGHAPWLLFVAVPIAMLTLWLMTPAARRRPASGWLLVAVWTVAILAAAAFANALTSAHTI